MWYQCRFLRTKSFKQNIKAEKIVVSEFATNAHAHKKVKPKLASRLTSIRGIGDVMSDNAMISINAIGEDYYCFYESPFLIQLEVDSLKTANNVDLNKAFGAISNGSHPHFDEHGNMITVGLKQGVLGKMFSNHQMKTQIKILAFFSRTILLHNQGASQG